MPRANKCMAYICVCLCVQAMAGFELALECSNAANVSQGGLGRTPLTRFIARAAPGPRVGDLTGVCHAALITFLLCRATPCCACCAAHECSEQDVCPPRVSCCDFVCSPSKSP